MIYGIALLIALCGFALIAFSVLATHRTPIPAFSWAAWLWWPGLGMIGFGGLVALAPSIVAYARCQSACDVIDGGAATEPYARNVPTDYENCVQGGLSDIRREVVERIKNGEGGLDPQRAVADAEPGLREVCAEMVVQQCVTVCYNPQPGEL